MNAFVNTALSAFTNTAMDIFAKSIHRLILAGIVWLAAVSTALAQPEFVDGNIGAAPRASTHQATTPQATTSQATEKRLLNTTKSAPATPNYSPAYAADKVRSAVGGQIINVSTRHHDNRVIYNVKVLNSGRMKIVRVDGQTGQLLN